MNFYIDEKDEERERARLSRDGEGRAFHPTPPPTPSHLNEVRELWRKVGECGGGGCAHFVVCLFVTADKESHGNKR